MKRKRRYIVFIAMLTVAAILCSGCKTEHKTTELKQENQSFEKKLMKKLSSAEKQARKDSKDIEKNGEQIRKSFIYISKNLGKVEEKENQPEMMDCTAYIYNLIVIRKDVHENKKNMTHEDQAFIKNVEKQNITKMVGALYNYLLSSGEAEYKDSLDEAEKYMKDIKKAGLDSEVKKLIDILAEK